MQVIIIEDEKIAARKLEKMLIQSLNLEVVACLHSVDEAVEWLSCNPHPKLIFSDIVLGDGLSFDIFEQVLTKSFIIYTTAYDDYTLRAFKLNSIDYLLKPISEEDLQKAFDKFKSYLPENEFNNSSEFKILLKQEQPKLNRILVKIGYQLKILKTQEICCFFTENKIVYAQSLERTYPIEHTLDHLEECLDKQFFFRVNRQFIINSEYIKNIHTSPNYCIELIAQPNVSILLSRDRLKDFKSWLKG